MDDDDDDDGSLWMMMMMICARVYVIGSLVDNLRLGVLMCLLDTCCYGTWYWYSLFFGYTVHRQIPVVFVDGIENVKYRFGVGA